MTADIDIFAPERRAILAEVVNLAAFDGFTAMSLANGADAAGLSRAQLAAAFPRGVRDLLEFWSLEVDREVREAMDTPEVQAMKIREKVAFAIVTRISILVPQKEAARRAAATLALPNFARLGAALTWKSADSVWRSLGDKSTDLNYYSKRAILSGVLGSTMAFWFTDESLDGEPTRDFIKARIENVMQIEKVKAQARKASIDPASIIAGLARLRYR